MSDPPWDRPKPCDECPEPAFGSTGRFCLPHLFAWTKAERARKAQVASVARQNATLARIDRTVREEHPHGV